MKLANAVFGILLSVLSATGLASEKAELSAERIKALVSAVNEASNRMVLDGSKVEDVDALFSLYTDDFVYVHEVYGGTYTREHLYRNSVRNLNAGRYKMTEGRYKILNVMTGLNAAAVERLEVKSEKVHLSVFEFKDEKVSRITEYWK